MIAQELYQSGRKVYLSVGSAGRVPRRYRGRDINDSMFREFAETIAPEVKRVIEDEQRGSAVI